MKVEVLLKLHCCPHVVGNENCTLPQNINKGIDARFNSWRIIILMRSVPLTVFKKKAVNIYRYKKVLVSYVEIYIHIF